MKALDIGEGVSGPYAVRTLAWLGADVVKVEPPEGDLSRRMGPFPDGVPHPEKSALFLALNAGKRGVTLDLESDAGRARFLELAADSRIVVDNHAPDWLSERGIGYEDLCRRPRGHHPVPDNAVRGLGALCGLRRWRPVAVPSERERPRDAGAGGRPELRTPDTRGRIPGRAGGGNGGGHLDAGRPVRGANERARLSYHRVVVRGDGDAGDSGAVQHRLRWRIAHAKLG